MPKVFTITEGLENMGALRSGGQGSVYKGRRPDGTITAIKLLPTPIYNESPEDKHYADFQNEVQKLKKVNEQPNPNVVKILSHGITDTGGFPFIEMEFIEGPDLEELLKEPHPPVFTIQEALKVASQLSNALSHCHSVGVKHGDVKSNNIKLNIHTDNYVLLDFGLAVMSDEQRRTSLRHAGAIEFMAPEQNEGEMLFQTDVYSFGIILFELLAGRVPFPLSDKGETARNQVRISHMEATLPDLLALRREHMPADWPEEQRSAEMEIPSWLMYTLERCLQKKPEERFANGMELHRYIAERRSESNQQQMEVAGILQSSESGDGQDAERLLAQYQQRMQRQEEELQALRRALAEKDQEPAYVESPERVAKRRIRPLTLAAIVLAFIALGAVAGYTLIKGGGASDHTVTNTVDPLLGDTVLAQGETPADRKTASQKQIIAEEIKNEKLPEEQPAVQEPEQQPQPDTTAQKQEEKVEPNNAGDKKEEEKKEEENKKEENTEEEGNTSARYKVINKAYFHNEPDESTRRNAFIIHWNNAVIKPLKEKDGFIYVVFTNHLGQTSRGWLRKKDLTEL